MSRGARNHRNTIRRRKHRGKLKFNKQVKQGHIVRVGGRYMSRNGASWYREGVKPKDCFHRHEFVQICQNQQIECPPERSSIEFLRDNFLKYKGWHHAGKKMKKTPFWQIDEEKLVEYYLNLPNMVFLTKKQKRLVHILSVLVQNNVNMKTLPTPLKPIISVKFLQCLLDDHNFGSKLLPRPRVVNVQHQKSNQVLRTKPAIQIAPFRRPSHSSTTKMKIFTVPGRVRQVKMYKVDGEYYTLCGYKLFKQDIKPKSAFNKTTFLKTLQKLGISTNKVECLNVDFFTRHFLRFHSLEYYTPDYHPIAFYDIDVASMIIFFTQFNKINVS